MIELFRQCLTLPTLLPSLLLGLVCAYWVLMILSGIDLDVFGMSFDTDLDPDGHDSFLDWGLVGLKWFNLGHVPFMVWLSAFALAAWLTSVFLDRGVTDANWQTIAVATARNFGVAMFAAKLFTQPFKDKFKLLEPNPAESLLGRSCVITTSEATPEFGQARIAVDDGAPLLVSVQTTEDRLLQGQEARIVDYSPEHQAYVVERVNRP